MRVSDIIATTPRVYSGMVLGVNATTVLRTTPLRDTNDGTETKPSTIRGTRRRVATSPVLRPSRPTPRNTTTPPGRTGGVSVATPPAIAIWTRVIRASATNRRRRVTPAAISLRLRLLRPSRPPRTLRCTTPTPT